MSAVVVAADSTASSSSAAIPRIMPDITAPRRCRHCAGFSLEDRITYSSVLVAGSALKRMVESIEERIIPCVTAVCPNCDRVSLISDGSTESMLCSIFMWQRLGKWIDTGYSEGSNSSAAVVAGIVKQEHMMIKEERESDITNSGDDDDEGEESGDLRHAKKMRRKGVVGSGASAFCPVSSMISQRD
jgi:hypothetical protein